MRKPVLIFASVLILCIFCLLNITGASAAMEGVVKEGMTWSLDDTGVLIVSGSGNMPDYSTPEQAPWHAYKGEIVKVILRGALTSVGSNAFYGCPSLKEVEFADTISSIGKNAFTNCPSIVSYEETPAEDMIQSFVTRCYKLILGRDPDAGGLQGWSESLRSKAAAAAQIIDGFVRSDEFTNRNLSAGDSVDILYQTMLDRKADEGGKTGWVDALNQGYSLQHIIAGFCSSDEFTAICKTYGIEPGTVNVNPVNPEPAPDTPREKIEAFVKRCYKLILNRDADEGGLQGWSDALETGAGQACQIIDGFVRSAEYMNRNLGNAESVDILYRTMLNRAADEGGKAGWVDALEKGYTLQHIINGFCGSAEFTNICNEFGITAGNLLVQGVIVKREAIAPEGEEEAPVVYVNYSSEYTNEEKIRAFVEHCYEAAFGREGDEEGIEAWTQLILDGKKTPKRIAYEFIFSDEFQNKLPGNEAFIRILYRLYLNREPGADELAGWIAMLENGAGLEEIVNGFAASEEFKAIVNGMRE